ncbi:hypothetical protein [Asaia astilbis]|uniref:hypothetical protein n=1 Tax=Asaia astilbis TaxID=610244 RepID=UPI00046FB944|nr:hypothetical protein [Asaia astilbis]
MSDLEIAKHVEGWVIKPVNETAPRRISEQDITLLVQSLRAQSGQPRDVALGALISAFQGWIVQRARGERPSALGEDVFAPLLDLLPSAGQAAPAPAPASAHQEVSSERSAADLPVESERQHVEAPAGPIVEEPKTGATYSSRLERSASAANLDKALFHLEYGV